VDDWYRWPTCSESSWYPRELRQYRFSRPEHDPKLYGRCLGQAYNTNGYQTFVSEDTNVEAAFFLQLRGDSRQFSFTIPYDFFVNPQSGFTPVVGQWYHLAGVYDAVAHSATLYVNGLLADQIFFVNPAAATGHSSIGRGQFGGNPVDFVNGAIDDVRFYQAALTGPEILEIARVWQSFLAGTATGAAGYPPHRCRTPGSEN
jgi:Concanavalin A-like lectin/glucanases superfamily